MPGNSRVKLLPAFGLLFAALVSPRVADAQDVSKAINGENIWTVMDVINAVNATIDESKTGAALREKAVSKFAECSLLYGGLTRKALSREAKQNYVQAQLATMEIETAIAKPMDVKRKLELEFTAQKSVVMTLDLAKSQGDKELVPFIRNCRSLNDAKQVGNILRDVSRD